MIPNGFAMVQQLVGEGWFARVAAGDGRAASLFARLVAFRLNPTADVSSWGWLTKSPGEQNYDGYAEDAIVYGSNPNALNNVVDLVAGAGAEGAAPAWAEKPRRPSNTWFPPRPLTEGESLYLRSGVSPVPVPTPTPVCKFVATAPVDLTGVLARLDAVQAAVLAVAQAVSVLERQDARLVEMVEAARQQAEAADITARDVRAALRVGLAIEAEVHGNRVTGRASVG